MRETRPYGSEGGGIELNRFWGPTIIGTETYDKASVDLQAAQWDRLCFRRQARTSASAVASDCSAYRNVV